MDTIILGQARKSLWIETFLDGEYGAKVFGQARKSLWIETRCKKAANHSFKVRLVRACGSKLHQNHAEQN